jgi:hypothetical protein
MTFALAPVAFSKRQQTRPNNPGVVGGQKSNIWHEDADDGVDACLAVCGFPTILITFQGRRLYAM